jgi:uncharacterized protein (DUF1015 family)
MATLKPFAALRPKADLAAKVCELPYDVMNSDEARVLAKDNPFSFLHVSKPEIDLEPSVDVYSDAVTGSWGKSKNGAFREIARIDVAEIGKSGYRGKTHIHINKAANHLPPYTRLPGE